MNTERATMLHVTDDPPRDRNSLHDTEHGHDGFARLMHRSAEHRLGVSGRSDDRAPRRCSALRSFDRQQRRFARLGLLLLAALGLVATGCKTAPYPAPPAVVSVVLQNRSMADITRAAQAVFTIHGYQGGQIARGQMVFQGMAGSMNNLTDDNYTFDNLITVRAVLTLNQVDANSVLVTCSATLLNAGGGQPTAQLRTQPFQEILQDIQSQLSR
jgi:hypothetical protein